jgi:exosortase/archaeosortase family protein
METKMVVTLLGIIIIHFVNVLRITALAIIVKVNPDWLYFNHNYTFTIVVYSFVFLLWWIWAKKYATPWLKEKDGLAAAEK